MREPQGDVKIQPNPRTHLGLCLDVFVRLLHVIENIFTLLLVYLDVHFVGKMYIYVMYACTCTYVYFRFKHLSHLCS